MNFSCDTPQDILELVYMTSYQDPDFMSIQECEFLKRIHKDKPQYRLNMIKRSCVKHLSSHDLFLNKQALNEGKFFISDYIIKQVLNLAQSQDIVPTVDAFASKEVHLFPKYWTRHSNAFNKNWQHEVLWINPPHNLFEQIVEKIIRHESRGIIFVPICLTNYGS